MSTETSRFHDFPDWLGPMLVKELRQGMKARGFEVSFIILQLVLAVVLSFHALLYVRSGSDFNSTGLSGIFWGIVFLQLLAVTPLRALGGLANERKANTLELIFMSGLSSWRITWGKWVSLQFQSLLFVLAVLPYGLLRYFFGGVNLTEELVTLAWVIVGSGVLSALALAVSGMPAFARIGSVLFIAFFGMSGLSMLMRLFIMGGGPPMSFAWTDMWLLWVYNIILIGFCSLELGASTIAPLAENHAMRQRLIVLATLVPVPILKWLGTTDTYIIPQVVLFGMLAMGLSWWHLASVPTALRVQTEPFSRRGLLGFVAGLVLQPGWPSAVLFLIVSEALLLFAGAYVIDTKDYLSFSALFIMGGASLLTPPLFWNIFRTAPKQLLLKHTLVLIVSGGLMAFANALEHSRDFAFGAQIWPALLPPFGFWAMLDQGLQAENVSNWQMAGLFMFLLQAALLILMASGYWKRMHAFHKEIVSARQEPVSPGEVAA